MKLVIALAGLVIAGICVAMPAGPSVAAVARAASCPQGDAVAMTEQGCVRGDTTEGVATFKGIPFAAPPVGDLRWKAPAAPAIRSSILEAHSFSPRCAQPSIPGASPLPQSEDCLYLNVWRPAKASGPLPVMVFIHGGGNTTGSASETPGGGGMFLYDGQYLAARGNVIVVTIQYRLNIFGYLVHPQLAAESGHNASGDYGLLDQIAAFRWVKDNIKSFGGDPAHVLLFGESGGGTDVCALVASPLAKGLFSAAIMESGGCEARPSAEMQAWSAGLVARAGCSQAADAIACLRRQDAASLLKVIDLTSVQPGGKIVVMSGPTIDGYVLPVSPAEALRTGEFNHVPFVIGVNAQETSSPLFRIPNMVSAAQYESDIRQQFPGALADRVLARYPIKNYASPRMALVAVTTDYQFICPARQYLRSAARAQSEPVYGYLYTNVMQGGPVRLLGAMHGLELYYVFQTINRLHVAYVPTTDDYRLEKVALGYWTQFAVSGSPNGGGLPLWPKFDPSTDSYLDLAATPAAKTGLGDEGCDFWNTLAQQIPGERVH